jgi:hypothetical protein
MAEPNSEQIPEQPQPPKRICEIVGAEIQKQRDSEAIDRALEIGSDAPMSKRIAAKVTRLQHGYTE